MRAGCCEVSGAGTSNGDVAARDKNRLLAVDVGGTFTDVVAVEDGQIEIAKVPTVPTDTENGVLEGAEQLNVAAAALFNHASTHGLNALLTRRLPKVAFLTTEGHRDMLEMGTAMRPMRALMDARWRRSFSDASAPLVPRYLRRGVTERVQADGTVFSPLDVGQAREQLALLRRCNVEGVAICLINAHANGVHEQALRALDGEELGDVPCSISSEVSPIIKEYPRATTTVIDVIMKLVYGEYTRKLQRGLSDLQFEGSLNFADSSSDLVAAQHAMTEPHRLVVAGPAAGTAASARLGAFIDRPNLVCVDVGGTSSDRSLVTNGSPHRMSTLEIEWDMELNSPSTEITSLGAGGGSIVAINSFGELTVGPASAAGRPGPRATGAEARSRPSPTQGC